MKVLYDTILKAKYTGRPNRFVVTIDLNGESVLAHLPNPGRMWELLFTGVTMYIVTLVNKSSHMRPGFGK